MKQEMESRKKREADFHDHLREEIPFQRYSRQAETALQGDKRWSNFKFYSIERRSRAFFDDWIRSRCRNKRVLDYGCGNGEDTIFAANNGAFAVGIDISEVSITHCKQSAQLVGLADRTEFLVMDAETLSFPDNSFDLVIVYGVLHHLDFAKAIGEISRVLKPEGQALCTEALGHNPLIRLYRKRTPHLRTEWETQHIVRRENLMTAKRCFRNVSWKTYHLATLAAVPFRHARLFPSILTALEVLDSALLRIPLVRWQAWQVVFELSYPRKN